MSNIFNILIQARIEEFDKINPAGAGNSNIKPGQIIIEHLTPKAVGVNGEVMLASGNWKPSIDSVFYLGQRFQMNIDVLYNMHSEGNKAIPVTELPKQLISISDPGIAYTTHYNKSMAMYNVKWSIVEKQFKCVTPENAWMHVLFANAETLGEASDNFTNSAADSLLAAYDIEAQFGSSLDAGMDFPDADMNEDTQDYWDDNLQNGSSDCHDAIV